MMTPREREILQMLVDGETILWDGGRVAYAGLTRTSVALIYRFLLEVDMSEEKWVNFEILEQEETEDRPWREIRRDMSAEAKRLNENI